MKKKIYISIPIAGHDYKKQRELADQVGRFLSCQGWDVVNPFNIYAGKDATYFDHICCDLRALADCEAVFFCEGWEKSLGCCIEHDFVMRCIAHRKKRFKIMYH